MAVPTWLSALGHFFSDVVGVMIGEELRERSRKAGKEVTEEAGKELRKVLLPDREDVMKALLHYRCDAIVSLLGEMNKAGGILKVAGRYQYENRVITLLLKVEEEDRQWVFTKLNDVCAEDQAKFFTLLEVLHNDGYKQLMKILSLVIKEKLRPHIEKANSKLRETQKKLRVDIEAEKGGLKRWSSLYK
ncbi:MAG: hypothetical protein G01um1014107_266 [Parcubacteria group bacterium Gr01-1014_107]|nr:MAG: hypothetical protein G01um1014107_266 [Parcubacteria group bacterium Gr01-1014_107]